MIYSTKNINNTRCFIAGVDEVGRGCLAGPVVAAAVILTKTNMPHGIKDSKVLSAKQRQIVYQDIAKRAVCFAIAAASVKDIDRLNIRQASLLAMQRALAKLPVRPHCALIDGIDVPNNAPCPAIAVVKGDTKHACIAAAAIVAKVCRDRLMQRLGQLYPCYGWGKNAGYGTVQHKDALHKHGCTRHHRQSFRPVRYKIKENSLLRYA